MRKYIEWTSSWVSNGYRYFRELLLNCWEHAGKYTEQLEGEHRDKNITHFK